jgi:hypothetical protein
VARRDLKIFVTADSRGAVRATGAATKGFSNMAKAAVAAGAAMGAAGLVKGAVASVKAASDLEEQMNKTRVVFRGSEKDILRWSKNTASALGISRREALESAGVFGNMLVPMGFARDRAGEMSKRMVRLAADMASFNNASPEDTLDALRAGLAGETEPLRRFGVFLNDARLKQEALNIGLKNAVGPNGALTANAKAQATYSLILKDSKDAQGDFARTSGSLANQQRILRAEVENLGAKLGKVLLPVVTDAVTALAKLVKQMQTGKGAGGDLADALSNLGDIAERAWPTVKEVFRGALRFVKEHPQIAAAAAGLTAVSLALRGIGGASQAGPIGRGLSGLVRTVSKAAVQSAAVAITELGGILGRLASRFLAPGETPARPLFVSVIGGVGMGGGGGGRGGKGVPAGTKVGLGALAGLGPAGAIVGGAGLLSVTGPQFDDPGKGKFRDRVLSGALFGKGGGGGLVSHQAFLRSKRDHAEYARDVKRSMGETGDAYNRTAALARTAFGKSGRELSQLRARTAEETQRIKERLGNDTAKGRDALKRHYREAADAAKRQMERAGVVTRQGVSLIRSLFVQELKLYGIDAKDAKQAVGQGGSRDDTFRLLGHQSGGKVRRPKAQQGMTVPGFGAGDKVHMQAMVEPGEQVFVLNRNASAVLSRLQQLNAAVPRFQGGGIVELLHPGNDPDHHDHLHLAMGNRRRLVALGRRLQRMGWMVGEHPAFGGVQGGHAPGGYHYTGQAIDVNWPNAAQERGKIAALLPMLQGLTRMAKVIKAPRVGGRGPIRDILQQGMNRTARAANRRLGALTRIEGAESIGGGSSANQALGRRLAQAYGWGGGSQWSALVELWNRESGWNNMARNPSSGAFGIPQALPATKMPAAAQRGDARSQILWGLRYIRGRYGSPSSALSFHNANNWYQRGGLVRRQRGGALGFRRPRSRIQPFQNWQRRNQRRKARQNRRQTSRPFSPGVRASALAEIFGFQATQFAAASALAGLTETTADDIAAAEAEARFWETWLPVAQANGDPVATATAAQGLRGARDLLADLRATSSGQANLAEEIRALREAIEHQTRQADSVAGIGQKTALKAFADVISGQIGGMAGQRARSAGDGVTAARYRAVRNRRQTMWEDGCEDLQRMRHR